MRWTYDLLLCFSGSVGLYAPSCREPQLFPTDQIYATMEECVKAGVENEQRLAMRPGWANLVSGIMCRPLDDQA